MIWTIGDRLLQTRLEDENVGVMKDQGHEKYAQRFNVSWISRQPPVRRKRPTNSRTRA